MTTTADIEIDKIPYRTGPQCDRIIGLDIERVMRAEKSGQKPTPGICRFCKAHLPVSEIKVPCGVLTLDLPVHQCDRVAQLATDHLNRLDREYYEDKVRTLKHVKTPKRASGEL
jgi:hypothetical protein